VGPYIDNELREREGESCPPEDLGLIPKKEKKKKDARERGGRDFKRKFRIKEDPRNKGPLAEDVKPKTKIARRRGKTHTRKSEKERNERRESIGTGKARKGGKQGRMHPIKVM